MTRISLPKAQLMRAVFALFFCALQACTQASNESRHTHHNDSYEGDLVKLLNKFYDPTEINSLNQKCDLDWKDRKYEMAHFLEKNRAVLSQLTTPQTQNPDCTIEHLPNRLQIYNCSKREPLDTWRLNKYGGWPEIYKTYQNLDLSKPDSRWQDLNSFYRHAISSDLSRIVYWTNMSLEPTDLESLLKVQEVIRPCLISQCNTLVFEPSIRVWMERRDYYSHHLKNIDRKIQDKQQFDWVIAGLQRRLQQDLLRFQTKTPPHNKLTNKDEVIVHMHIENAELRLGLEKYFSNAWSQHGLSVKIQWLDTTALDIFSHILFILEPVGARGAFQPSWGSNPAAIIVPQIVRAGTLVHEFGHALGLADSYFEIFDPERCAYDSWNNEADIMSNSVVGRVLPSHTKEILSAIK